MCQFDSYQRYIPQLPEALISITIAEIMPLPLIEIITSLFIFSYLLYNNETHHIGYWILCAILRKEVSKLLKINIMELDIYSNY